MVLHFPAEEFAGRRQRAVAAMAEAGLDGLLLFRQESLYYLTGYDTFGWVFFQCLFLGADGRMVLLTRAPDLRQAQQTSDIADIRIWTDEGAADPAGHLRTILDQQGCRGQTLGVEWDAYGLTAARGQALAAALAGFCRLADASLLVSRLRLRKSAAELAYHRDAAALCDAAYRAAIATARPGVGESEVLAAMQGAMLKAGGDFPANPIIIGSGEAALLCRYHTGRRRLAANDQLTLEWAGVYRHYHACLMRTLIFGTASPARRAMYSAAAEALEAAVSALRPGLRAGDAFEAHARILDAAGYRKARMNACGYSLGATFPPHWMDWPMLFRGCDTPLAPDMVFFVHIIIFDSETGLAMTLGRSVLIEETGPVALTQSPEQLVEIT